MLNYLSGYIGNVTVNGVFYSSVNEAITALDKFSGELFVELNQNVPQTSKKSNTTVKAVEDDKLFRITVKKYMTMPSSADFDFQQKWNSDVPMPYRIMVGRVIKETKGMYKMELWAQVVEEVSSRCMKCGRPLTNDVSKFFGIGPECGGHGYTHPFNSDEELKAEVEKYNKQLIKESKWTGWVIKSAITEKEELEIVC